MSTKRVKQIDEWKDAARDKQDRVERWRTLIDTDLPERFSVPPEYQGQMVEYAYAGGAEGIFERITDLSDTESGVTINVYAYKEDTEECMEACEPWNRTPRLGKLLWTENITAS